MFTLNGGSVSASYFEVNKTLLASRRRKPTPTNSIYNTGEDHVPDNILLIEALRFVKQKSNRHKISALVINCEGCEYSLINFLTENRKELATISTVIVQYHRNYIIPGIDSLTDNYCELKMRLSRTHCLLWNFNYVWEAWVSHEYCIWFKYKRYSKHFSDEIVEDEFAHFIVENYERAFRRVKEVLRRREWNRLLTTVF